MKLSIVQMCEAIPILELLCLKQLLHVEANIIYEALNCTDV